MLYTQQSHVVVFIFSFSWLINTLAACRILVLILDCDCLVLSPVARGIIGDGMSVHRH